MQTALVVKTLKKQLKANGKTYKDVATALELSEASVKRLFSEHHFSLKRLEQVSQLAGLELCELFQIVNSVMNQEHDKIAELEHEQELQIAKDIVLLMLAVSVINGYSYTDILEQYQLDEHLVFQKLAQLDKMKLIELQPGNRIKLLVAPNFNWRVNGPIQRFFQKRVVTEFFNSAFAKDNEKLVVVNGLLSENSNQELQIKMQRLAQEFTESHLDEQRKSMDKKSGTTLVLALRQWQFSGFSEYLHK